MNRPNLISETLAFQLVEDEITLSKTIELPLSEALGQILREDIIAEREAPPFDRVMMDGIAINTNDLSVGTNIFPISGIARAGHPQEKLLPKQAIEVCTGAIVPQNANKIIPYENLFITNNKAEIVTLNDESFIHQRGSDFQKETILLRVGQRLNSPVIGLCASQGKAKVKVSKTPQIAIISTGDELVDLEERTLETYQIRRSNSYALSGELHSWGFTKTKLIHLPDDKLIMSHEISNLLGQYDFLIFIGGISKGAFDFLPAIFEENKIKKIFHQVAQKPGKPLFFGKGPQGQLIFALPGNPVSALINLRRYIVPALLKQAGTTILDHYFVNVNEPLTSKKDFTQFIPATLENSNGKFTAHPLRSNNSGDYHSLTHSHGFLLVNENNPQEAIPFYPWGQWNFYGPEF